MKLSVPFILLVIGAAVASKVLESFGISRDLSAAGFLSLGFTGLLAHRTLILKKRLNGTDLLLATPIWVVLVLVSLKEAGLLAVPSAVIWVAFTIIFIPALGYASPRELGRQAPP